MTKEKIEAYAKSLGFDLVGFSSVNLEKSSIEFYKKWIEKKYHGQMKYLEKINPRKNLLKILSNAKTVISLGMNYYYKQNPLKKGFGRVARYAYGRDYHKIIGKKLKQLEVFIKTLDSKANTKSFVDAGPILERTFAEKSGLGITGKNCCLITKEFGSWVFLAEIITDVIPALPVIPAKAGISENLSTQTFPLCGSCTRCMDSCPTKAIIAPGVIDARKCISYLTIENKKQIPKKFHKILKKEKRLFGCDICQEVCPHNCRAVSVLTSPVIPDPNVVPAKAGTSENLPEQTFAPETLLSRKIAGDSQNLKKILSLKTDQDFLNLFAGSPLMRAKRKTLQRTAKILS